MRFQKPSGAICCSFLLALLLSLCLTSVHYFLFVPHQGQQFSFGDIFPWLLQVFHTDKGRSILEDITLKPQK